jgi:hypothetical protein
LSAPFQLSLTHSRTYEGTARHLSTSADFALSLFHRERHRAIAAYARFVDENVNRPSASPLAERNSNDPRILGSDDFAAKLLGTAWQPRSRKTLSDVIAEACRQFSVTEDALLSLSSQRHLTKVRAWIAHQAILLRIASLSYVARHFRRTEAALRHSVKRHFNYP